MSWDGIKEYVSDINKELQMPFGRHKGLHPSQIPISYCIYLADNDIDKKVGKYFSKAIRSRIWHYKKENKTE